MRLFFHILVLLTAPILGMVIATVIAYQVYPGRDVPANASRAESLRIINLMFEDVSGRGQYILVGGSEARQLA